MEKFPDNCVKWLLTQETKVVTYLEVKVGDIICLNDLTYASEHVFWLVKAIPGRAKLAFVGEDGSVGETDFSLAIYYNWKVVQCDWSKFNTDPDRKDYCHPCQNEKLIWNMMAARCSMCERIILGGC